MNILNKLGSGAFANVYLAETETGMQFALKISKIYVSQEETIKYSNDEVAILSLFKLSTRIVNLLYYEITNEKNHIGMELLGKELYDLTNYYNNNNQLIPISVVKHISKQLLEGLVEMASNDILHNDLKIENILFTKDLLFLNSSRKKNIINILNAYNSITDDTLKDHIEKFSLVMQEHILLCTNIKISDFGNSFSKESSINNKKEFNRSRPTRHYIAPEIIINSPHWIESDMWSLGCIIYELLTGDVLFDPTRENNMGINSMHLAQIIETFGPFTNSDIINGTKSKKYFNQDCMHKFNYLISKKESFKYRLQQYNFSKIEIKNIMDFLLPFFNYDQNKRITPFECLKSKWFL